jgi:hypothetical protein
MKMMTPNLARVGTSVTEQTDKILSAERRLDDARNLVAGIFVMAKDLGGVADPIKTAANIAGAMIAEASCWNKRGGGQMINIRTSVAIAALMIAAPAMAQSVTETTTVTKSVTVNRGLGAGTQGVCQTVGIVYGLDPYGKNNLSVRYTLYGPPGPANEKDQLYTNDRVRILGSAPSRHGLVWYHVMYDRNEIVTEGWVSSAYVSVP